MPQPFRIRRPDVHHGMMHMRRASRTKLRHLHPAVFRKMRRHDLVRVFDFAVRLNRYRLRHLQHQVGLRNIPPRSPLSRRWRLGLVSRRRTRFRPLRNRRNFPLAYRCIIRKMPIARIGKPRWHHLHLHRMSHGLSPGPSLLVGQECHRCDLARTMATLAMILEDWQHVFVERRRRTIFQRPGRGPAP